MLTFQAAGTASRSNKTAGTFAKEQVTHYIDSIRPSFTGPIQIQGGITIATIREVGAQGAEFLVCETQIFHHKTGMTPLQVIDEMLREASQALMIR
jgi:pentose-5-phosphate-3-epimerase